MEISKKRQVLNLIRKKLKGYTKLSKWFENTYAMVDFYIYTECAEKYKERYHYFYLDDRDGNGIEDFRGSHHSCQILTYKEYKKVHKDVYNHKGEIDRKSDIMLHGFGETIESLAWLLLHELGHRHMRNVDNDNDLYIITMLNGRHYNNVNEEKGEDVYWNLYNTTDKVHEDRPEEVFCNLIATHIIGNNLDRYWWRKNKEATK